MINSLAPTLMNAQPRGGGGGGGLCGGAFSKTWNNWLIQFRENGSRTSCSIVDITVPPTNTATPREPEDLTEGVGGREESGACGTWPHYFPYL